MQGFRSTPKYSETLADVGGTWLQLNQLHPLAIPVSRILDGFRSRVRGSEVGGYIRGEGEGEERNEMNSDNKLYSYKSAGGTESE